ncbi:hypothetical protein NUW54_g11054 [Trametes sanguinea]|uniref:Uncharacterized protein n=1 Tax=Trametes sanguinea TaxID=158606 RepID=A0ACC1NMC2_9APHY|nr:hypothetical protein NUW54_g11054 [Trametes sanguinea]
MFADHPILRILADLAPSEKGGHIRRNWSQEARRKAEALMEKIFAERYHQLHENGQVPATSVQRTKRRLAGLLRNYSDDESEAPIPPGPVDSSSAAVTQTTDPGASKPYAAEFRQYLDTVDHIPDGMAVIRWWGVREMILLHRHGQFAYLPTSQLNASRYPVWASLARDYLAIQPTSVSSERAFSHGGLTVDDRRTRLKADIVEALQFLKCAIREDLMMRIALPMSSLEAELELNDEGAGDSDAGTAGGVSETYATTADSTNGWDIILDEGDDSLFESQSFDSSDDVYSST